MVVACCLLCEVAVVAGDSLDDERVDCLHWVTFASAVKMVDDRRWPVQQRSRRVRQSIGKPLVRRRLVARGLVRSVAKWFVPPETWLNACRRFLWARCNQRIACAVSPWSRANELLGSYMHSRGSLTLLVCSGRRWSTVGGGLYNYGYGVCVIQAPVHVSSLVKRFAARWNPLQ